MKIVILLLLLVAVSLMSMGCSRGDLSVRKDPDENQVPLPKEGLPGLLAQETLDVLFQSDSGVDVVSTQIFAEFRLVTHVGVVAFTVPAGCDANIAGAIHASSGNRIALLGWAVPFGTPLDRFQMNTPSSQQIVFEGGSDSSGEGGAIQLGFAASFQDPVADAMRLYTEASDACGGQWTPTRSDDLTPLFLDLVPYTITRLPDNGVYRIDVKMARRL